MGGVQYVELLPFTAGKWLGRCFIYEGGNAKKDAMDRVWGKKRTGRDGTK